MHDHETVSGVPQNPHRTFIDCERRPRQVEVQLGYKRLVTPKVRSFSDKIFSTFLFFYSLFYSSLRNSSSFRTFGGFIRGRVAWSRILTRFWNLWNSLPAPSWGVKLGVLLRTCRDIIWTSDQHATSQTLHVTTDVTCNVRKMVWHHGEPQRWAFL